MVKVAVCQMAATGTKEENVAKIINMAEKAVKERGPLDVICFPEDSYYDPDARSEANRPEPIPGYFSDKMCELAKRLHVNLIPGSFQELAPNGKFYNSVMFINRDGKVIGKYHKIHLMKALGYDEGEYTNPGEEECVIDTDFGRIGIMVCYDMRFPELARGMVQKGAEIIFVPAYFPAAGNMLPPRTDHWDIMLRATSIFNLTYTVAANQYGNVVISYPFGRSCVIDPWGMVVAQSSNREDIIYADLDFEYQRQVRESVATWQNRRPEIYSLK